MSDKRPLDECEQLISKKIKLSNNHLSQEPVMFTNEKINIQELSKKQVKEISEMYKSYHPKICISYVDKVIPRYSDFSKSSE